MDKILVALGLREARRVVIRRDPLTEVADIIVSEEAMDMIWFALKTCPPGTPLRWNKLMTVANREIPPGDTIEEDGVGAETDRFKRAAVVVSADVADVVVDAVVDAIVDAAVNAAVNAVNSVVPGGRGEASEESAVAFSFIVGLEENEDVVGAKGAFSGNEKETVG